MAKQNGIPDRELFVNWTSGPLKGVTLSTRMMFDKAVESSYFGSYKDLHIGWNRVPIDGRQGEIFVD